MWWGTGEHVDVYGWQKESWKNDLGSRWWCLFFLKTWKVQMAFGRSDGQVDPTWGFKNKIPVCAFACNLFSSSKLAWEVLPWTLPRCSLAGLASWLHSGAALGLSALISCPTLSASVPLDTLISCPLPLMFSLWRFLLTSIFVLCLLSWPSTLLSERMPKILFEEVENNLVLSKITWKKNTKREGTVERLTLKQWNQKKRPWAEIIWMIWAIIILLFRVWQMCWYGNIA